MSSAAVRNKVIWIILSLVVLSWSFGILLANAVQKAMQNDPTFLWIWLLGLLPLFVLVTILNTRRILKAIP